MATSLAAGGAPKIGDRVAYSARFLRDTGQQTGPAPQRRGTFRGIDDAMNRKDARFARVDWDDTDYVALAAQYGADYADEAREKGSLVALRNIARVGSPRYALTDI